MELEYKALLGRPVILEIALGDVEVPLRGKLLLAGMACKRRPKMTHKLTGREVYDALCVQ